MSVLTKLGRKATDPIASDALGTVRAELATAEAAVLALLQQRLAREGSPATPPS